MAEARAQAGQPQRAAAQAPAAAAAPQQNAAALIAPALRGAKCPTLDSIDPQRFEEFVFNYTVFAENENWNEHTKKVNALLSLSGKASEHLRLLVTNWRDAHITLDHIFDAWTRRVLPQAQVNVAIKNVSTIQQHLDESFDDYLLRGQGMHRFAYSRIPGRAEAETDRDFIVRLTAGLLDRNIKAHVERAQPQTITAFREIVHREAAIALDPSNRTGPTSINAISSEAVNAIDPTKSHAKPQPPCEVCNDKMHATSQCALLVQLKQQHHRDQKTKRSRSRSSGSGGRGGRGRPRGNKTYRRQYRSDGSGGSTESKN